MAVLSYEDIYYTHTMSKRVSASPSSELFFLLLDGKVCCYLASFAMTCKKPPNNTGNVSRLH